MLYEPCHGKEHSLPRGFGSFQGHHILPELVCRECNKPISKAEEQFLRVGPEGLLRQTLGITGRKHHKKISPFLGGSSGAPPIEIKHPFTIYIKVNFSPKVDRRKALNFYYKHIPANWSLKIDEDYLKHLTCVLSLNTITSVS